MLLLKQKVNHRPYKCINKAFLFGYFQNKNMDHLVYNLSYGLAIKIYLKVPLQKDSISKCFQALEALPPT